MLRLLCSAAPVAALAVLPALAPAQGQRGDTLALSIQDAVVLALRSSDEVRFATAQVDVADAQLTIARASALPQLRINGSYQHVYENARGQAVGQIFNQPNTYNINGNLSQPIFQGGRVIAGWRAANQIERAARLNAAETRAQLSLDVQRAYLEVLYANRALEIRVANYELANERVAQIERFASAGRAARYDVLRARVERTNLDPMVIQTRNDRDLAMLTLKSILNIQPDRPVALTTTIDASSAQLLLAATDADSSRGENRPAVRAAELTAEARRQAIRVARADLLPSVSAFLQMGYQAFPTNNVFPTQRGRLQVIECPPESQQGRVCTTQNGGFFHDRFVGVQVSWPLFDGLRVKGNIDLARAQAVLAEVQLAQQREAAAIDIARARAELSRARALFAARQENAEEADEAFRLASLRFARGLSTQLEVTDAQFALLTARTDEARAVYDLYLASAGLARAQGRPIVVPATPSAAAPTSSKLDQ